MIDTYIPNQEKSIFDNDITAIINNIKFATYDDINDPWVIGIRNEMKKIYRRLTVQGLWDYVQITCALDAGGYKDLLFNREDPVRGYDAIFYLAS
ncbi:hypothetical protein NF98_13810 [Salmonella enterica subsp. enterica serovar Rubislaw]|nr:hypothetical protein [Salmonella enterica]EBL5122789.1 hypothetical protein [Salmonella enterica subsp. enterica serovar Rubislaw]